MVGVFKIRHSTTPVRAEPVEASARMVQHFDKLSANGDGEVDGLRQTRSSEACFSDHPELVEGQAQDARALRQAQCERDCFLF
jgi:hypothetical protein